MNTHCSSNKVRNLKQPKRENTHPKNDSHYNWLDENMGYFLLLFPKFLLFYCYFYNCKKKKN